MSGNVVLTCCFANFGKSDADLKVFLQFLEVIRKSFNPIAVSVCNPVSTGNEPVFQQHDTPPSQTTPKS